MPPLSRMGKTEAGWRGSGCSWVQRASEGGGKGRQRGGEGGAGAAAAAYSGGVDAAGLCGDGGMSRRGGMGPTRCAGLIVSGSVVRDG